MVRAARAGATAELAVGISDLAVLKGQDRVLVTHALGSCIGLAIYDPVAKVGGLLHFMLDRPRNSKRAENRSEAMYATTGIPAVFRAAYNLGATKERLIVVAAGGAEMIQGAAGLRIGARNHVMLRKLLWKNGLVLAAEDTGGSDARTMRLDLSNGTVHIDSRNSRSVLWAP